MATAAMPMIALAELAVQPWVSCCSVTCVFVCLHRFMRAQQGNKAIAHHLNMSSTNLELCIDILQGACVRIHGSKRKARMSHPNLMQ